MTGSTVPHRGIRSWRSRIAMLSENRRFIGCAILPLCLVLVVLPPSAHAAPTIQHVQAPTNLQVELNPQPLAVENLTAPHFSWVVQDAQVGAMQAAYEIQVATSAALLSAHTPDVWDSGKITGALSTNVAYAGPALQAATRYWWTVRTWASDQQFGAWATPATFGTAVKTTWQGQPIWAPDYSAWVNYSIDVDITFQQNAAGIIFRAKDLQNYYMWQFRSDDSHFRPHVQVGGTFTVLKDILLPMTLSNGTTHHVKITANGATISTWIDGVLIDTTTTTIYTSGVIGFRQGGAETAVYDNVVVRDLANNQLYGNTFGGSANDFPCGQISNGALAMGKGAACILPAGNTWAFLRHEVTLPAKSIAWATAYATALSPDPARQYVYHLAINGHAVGNGPTRALTTATVAYNAYDVTGLLRSGQANALGVVAYTTTDKRFLFQMVVAFTDGTRQVISSSNQWKAAPGTGTYPAAGSIGTSYYSAPVENLNATSYPLGFDQAGYPDQGWSTPLVGAAIAPAALMGLPTQNVAEQDAAPVTITQVAAGHYFLDFGRTWVGGIKLTLNGIQGQTVQIRLGEELSAPNTVRYQLRTGNTYQDTWTLRSGTQTLQHWGYRVFRYAEIIGTPQALTTANVAATALLYPNNSAASSFSSSDANLNTVWNFSKDSVAALNLDLYLDSPTRERGPEYGGDNYIHLLAQTYTAGDHVLGRYSNDWSAQNPDALTEWELSSILAAWQYWQDTGDTTDLANLYTQLQNFLPTKYLQADGLVHRPISYLGGPAVAGTTQDLVDWPAGERDGFVFAEVNTVVNAWSYRAYADMAQIATALGKSSDATQYQTTAQHLQTGVNTYLYDATQGAYRDGLNADGSVVNHHAIHATVYPLAFGVATTTQAGPAAAYLLKHTSSSIPCSVFCANFLLEALYATNHGTEAINLMTADTLTSWRHMIDLGAGATMEAWDPSLKPNLTFSHPWSAGPAYIAPAYVFGIQPLSPGYATFQVHLQPGTLSSGNIVVPSIKGAISVAFTASAQGIKLTLTVPANTTATVSVPQPPGAGTTVTVDGQAVTARAQNGYLYLDTVTAGSHVIIAGMFS